MPKKIVAAIQSNYIPWKGYFDIINSADEFVIYDDVQYTVRDWRNRNKIITPYGIAWLTIPVETKSKYLQKIQETKIADKNWNINHWKSLVYNYARAPFFKKYQPILENIYLSSKETNLSLVNLKFIKTINEILGIKTKISWSKDYHLDGQKTHRLVSLCKKIKATHYLSGPSAKIYLDESEFKKQGIEVMWMDYSGYPNYKQLCQGCIHQVTFLDLLFNTGPDANKYMKSFKK